MYYRIEIILGAGILLIIITLLLKRKFFWGILFAEAIGSIFLSYYIFYYIGTYISIPDDIMLSNGLNKVEEGLFSLDVDITWDRKPEIFGFDGEEDLLIIRYIPADVRIISSNFGYGGMEEGKCKIRLSKGFEYAKIPKNQREIYFNVKDGKDFRVNMVMKSLKEDTSIKVFFIHDYRAPFDSSSFWEKYCDVQLK